MVYTNGSKKKISHTSCNGDAIMRDKIKLRKDRIIFSKVFEIDSRKRQEIERMISEYKGSDWEFIEKIWNDDTIDDKTALYIIIFYVIVATTDSLRLISLANQLRNMSGMVKYN